MVLTLGLVFVLLGCEVLLHIATAVSPRIAYVLSPPWTRITVPDPILGRRPSPYCPGHDARGFRNPQTRTRCEVLAVGDSLTYGYAAEAEESWPRELERQLGTQVVSMAFGGYGPCEYLALVSEGLRLKPSVVVVGVFASNDLVDSYESTWLRGSAPQFLAAEREPAIRRAQRQRPLLAAHDQILGIQSAVAVNQPSWIQRSKLWGLLRSLRQLSPGVEATYLPAARASDPFEVAVARHGRVGIREPFPTVFMPPRLFGLKTNPADPRIVDGERIALAALEGIRRQVRAAGAQLIVALFPSKHVVLAESIAAVADSGPEALHELLDAAGNEQAAMARLARALLRAKVTVVDTTLALREAVASGRAPFHASDDEHPNALGYAVMASAIQPSVRSVLGR